MNDQSTIALSAQIGLLKQTDVIANNLANLSTTGFKGESMLFAEYLGRGQDGQPASYAQDIGTTRDTREGPVTRTGNPLDVAIEGEGYLAVDTPLGTRYTRNGHFQLDANGQLVTSQGYPVLSDGDSPLTVPNGAGEITISATGTITTARGGVGRLQVATFPNEQAMISTGNGFYTTDQTPQPPPATTLVQGSLEGANVQPVIELTRLMSVQRGVAFTKDFIDAEATRMSTAIDRLGKLPT